METDYQRDFCTIAGRTKGQSDAVGKKEKYVF